MQNLQDIQEKIFFECKTVLESLSKINSREELLSKQDLFSELSDRIAFLRILEKNKESFTQDLNIQTFNNQEETHQSLTLQTEENFEDPILFEDKIEEEVIFTNEINDIENEEEFQTVEEQLIIDEHQIQETKEDITLVIEQEEPNYAERIAQKEKEFLEMEERRRKIVEFRKEDIVHPPQENVEEPKEEPTSAEKKFKLAHIKGLKAVQNLFDEDPLEKLEIGSPIRKETPSDYGSIIKNNIPTDFMEAEKRKPEFRLDLNDKVTFIKHLFNGDADELKLTTDKLNSYNNLEDAKQYLSEVYYAKDWRKVDEYAQRLWSLVENKFL